jgi:hypothetical protein
MGAATGRVGHPIAILETNNDITERKRGSIVHWQASSRNDRHWCSAQEILDVLCLTIEGYTARFASFAAASRWSSSGSIAGPSLPEEWTQRMERLPIGPCAGSCGTRRMRITGHSPT